MQSAKIHTPPNFLISAYALRGGHGSEFNAIGDHGHRLSQTRVTA
jgi:hypothetical protein